MAVDHFDDDLEELMKAVRRSVLTSSFDAFEAAIRVASLNSLGPALSNRLKRAVEESKQRLKIGQCFEREARSRFQRLLADCHSFSKNHRSNTESDLVLQGAESFVFNRREKTIIFNSQTPHKI